MKTEAGGFCKWEYSNLAINAVLSMKKCKKITLLKHTRMTRLHINSSRLSAERCEWIQRHQTIRLVCIHFLLHRWCAGVTLSFGSQSIEEVTENDTGTGAGPHNCPARTIYPFPRYPHCLLHAVIMPVCYCACCSHPYPVTAGLCGLEHKAEVWSDADCRCEMWRELGLAVPPTRAEV